MKNLIISELPYEKFVSKGPASLTDSELLAIILRSGTKEANVLDISRQVLEHANYQKRGLNGLHNLSLKDLEEIKGVGPVAAVKLKAITELSMRMHKEVAKESFIGTSPASVANFYMEELRHLQKEVVFLACLDSKCSLISSTKMSEGSINKSLISPRSIFLESLNHKAVNIILIHNHPSGDPKPSSADIRLTHAVYELGMMLEIMLLDHIIIGDNTYFSFREKDLLIPAKGKDIFYE